MDWLDWILLVARVLIVFVALLLILLIEIWFERKWIADLQTRKGPMRAGPRGILITLADGLKVFFKEGITPTNAEMPLFVFAPALAVIPAFLTFAVIPFGPTIEVFGREVPMQVADLNIGVLWLAATASIGVYAIVLAGWSSGSNYPLLGGVRASAQMISYEVGMSLAFVAVVMYSGTLSLNEVVASQDRIWNVIPQLPAFLIYFVCALAETNRPPFDLAEAESELVAGFQTEYSGMRFAMFYLAEYLNAFTVCAIATTLFLGGWRGPAPDLLTPLWPVLWFLAKVFALFYVMVWIRGTLPRVRYDRLMNFGWKVLIPLGLVWVMLTGAVVVLPEEFDLRRGNILTIAAIAAAVIIVLSLVWPAREDRTSEEVGRR
ncbi:MAG: NADH-quinone oxidoreductase subunit NuoH [Actinomycetota bacterium]